MKRFAGLAKKVWNPRLFKSQVSPHEFLQEVNRASAGKFRLEQRGDPVEFLGWLLNKLHKDMGGTKKKNSSESRWGWWYFFGSSVNRYCFFYIPGGTASGNTASPRSSRRR